MNSFDDLLEAGFSEADVKNFRDTYDSVHDIDLFPAGMYIFLNSFHYDVLKLNLKSLNKKKNYFDQHSYSYSGPFLNDFFFNLFRF